MTDDLLRGSGDNYGALRRVGATVIRPAGPHSHSVRTLLDHLALVGFDGAPRVISVDAEHEVLTFIDGEVPVAPDPPGDGWIVVSDRRAASVASLLRRFHDAAATFRLPDDSMWQGGRSPGLTHSVVCHNDPVVGNVIFRGDDAVALIDFDFAGPNDPLRDLAIAAQHWIPLGDPGDFIAPPTGWSAAARLAGMCRAYRLPDHELPRLLDLAADYLQRGRLGVWTRVQAGEQRFVDYWEAGLGDRLARALVWLQEERGDLMLPRRNTK